MNTGVICNRYATALLLLVRQTGRGEQTYDQAMAMLAGRIPDPLEDSLEKLTALLIKNGRTEYLKQILWTFTREYRRKERICQANLTVARKSEALEEKLKVMFLGQGAEEVDFSTEVDPGLIGGFVLEVGDNVLDTSIKRQLALVRHDLDEMNKRLV